eukprot:PhF_6_TR33601/c0_g1_i1/m.49055
MSFEETKNYINGEWVLPNGVPIGTLKDPNDGKVLMTQHVSSPEQVELALTAAQDSFRQGLWSRSTVAHRVTTLQAMAEAVGDVESQLGLVEATHTGINVSFMTAVASSLKFVIRDFCNAAPEILAETTYNGLFGKLSATRVPLGPALIIAPWNVPCGTIITKLVAALLAGCSVIIKPSEWAPTSIVLLVKAMVEKVSLPPGVLQVVLGDGNVGKILVKSQRIRCVQFTGSVPVGKSVGEVCGSQLKPMLLELGGSNCAIVFADADISVAVQNIVRSLTFLNGQWCMGVARIIADRTIAGKLFEELVGALKKLRVGMSTNKDFGEEALGPLSFKEHVDRLNNTIQTLVAAGGVAHRIEVEDNTIDKSCFIPPTLLTGVPHLSAAALELFGPVATFHTFETTEHALVLANESTGKLAAYLFSTNVEAAQEFGKNIATGMVMINGVQTGFMMQEGEPEPEIQFWNDAGYGTDGSPAVLLKFFCGKRVIGPNGPARSEGN